MAYDTNILFAQAKEAIIKNKLMFIEEVVAYLPCVKSTFYEHFPNDPNAYKEGQDNLYQELFNLIEKNKIITKATMRGKWYKSTAPALQIGLYKLIATPEERRALNSHTHEIELPEDTEIQIKIHR